ncbi:hypothetical protein [Enterococcus canis]|uniref:hypothetical protein n=1 Tax=Enterococcus canis TaxID=214095 RepID=UPI0008336870|nr:hypothetical protein [Enterococcus canis]
MTNKMVAGTIMLNRQDGTKAFLVHPHEGNLEFATTSVTEEMTGLASVLKMFKEEIHINVSAINLVELTNAHVEEVNLPLFVFEMDEEQSNEIDQEFVWEGPSNLKNLLSSYDFNGVPQFT